MAEWFAGQLIGREVDKIPTARQAFMQVQEHSTEKDQMPVSEDISAVVLDASKLSPSFKNWLVVRSVVNLGYRFLAIDLDKPQQPTADQV